MPEFLDGDNRRWSLRLDVATIRRVRAASGIDLARVFSDDEQRQSLFANVETVVDVIFEIVRPRAEVANVTPEQFGAAMFGDALGAAIEALEGSVIEFLPESRSRAIARRMVDAGRMMQTRSKAMIAAAMDKGLMETAIDEHLARLEGDLARLLNSAAPPPSSTHTVSGR